MFGVFYSSNENVVESIATKSTAKATGPGSQAGNGAADSAEQANAADDDSYGKNNNVIQTWIAVVLIRNS